MTGYQPQKIWKFNGDICFSINALDSNSTWPISVRFISSAQEPGADDICVETTLGEQRLA